MILQALLIHTRLSIKDKNHIIPDVTVRATHLLATFESPPSFFACPAKLLTAKRGEQGLCSMFGSLIEVRDSGGTKDALALCERRASQP